MFGKKQDAYNIGMGAQRRQGAWRRVGCMEKGMVPTARLHREGHHRNKYIETGRVQAVLGRLHREGAP